MKEIFNRLAAYNLWANRLLTGALEQLPEADWHRPLGGSFTTVYETLLHIWNAESIWWQRMKLQEVVVPPADARPEKAAVVKGLLQQSAQWQQWVQQATEVALQHEFIYMNSKREAFKNPVHEVLSHLFNHGTYHRGQLVNYLRQLGAKTVPATDFIAFTRKK